MTPTPTVSDEQIRLDALERLEALRVYKGAPTRFWTDFLQIALGAASATDAVLFTRSRTAEGSGLWKESICWPPNTSLCSLLTTERGILERLGLQAEGDGAGTLMDRGLVAVRLATGELNRSAIVIVQLGTASDIVDATFRLRLLADAPLLYHSTRALDQARNDMLRFAVVLDLMVLVNAQMHFMGAAMTLCNELASRYRCDRVGLGWQEHGYVRLQALSHVEKFERKMAVITALEHAMDEAMDQDEEILWPAPKESTAVVRDHETYAKSQEIGHLLSLPIRIDSYSTGVLTLERDGIQEFTPQELQTLRLLCDHAARRLHELKRLDRWFGARFSTWIREKCASVVGPEHTGVKLTAVALAAVLGILFLGKAEYRVEAPFSIKCDALAQVPAPFDGFMDEVHFRVGDPVHSGQLLLGLDVRELLLQEAAADAEQQRFTAEARKAEGDDRAADMRIAQAAADEAGARLGLSRYHLQQAQILAPFDGIVIEGDWRERRSAPVKQGDVLVKIANIEAMYPEIAVPERDVHEIQAGQKGEIAFTSRPQFSFPMEVEQVEPLAQVHPKEGNVFMMRATFSGKPEPWWRPGMSGVCKVNTGKRNLFWIFMHRSIDFLRLYLWW